MDTNKIITGIVTSAVISGAAAMAMKGRRTRQLRHAKKTINKTLKNVGHIVDSFM